MSDIESDKQHEEQSVDLNRRDLLKKGAAVAVLLPYVIPMIQSLKVPSAFAGHSQRSKPPGDYSPPKKKKKNHVQHFSRYFPRRRHD
jgi:hypothetical protein